MKIENGMLTVDLSGMGLPDGASEEQVLHALVERATRAYQAKKPVERPAGVSMNVTPTVDAKAGTVEYCFSLRFKTALVRSAELVG